MKNRSETHPSLQSKLDAVEQQMRRARRVLNRQVQRALAPLDIQEDVGISQIRGDVLIVSANSRLQRKVQQVLQSERYRSDIAEDRNQAIGYLKLGVYRLVVLDRLGRGRSQVFQQIQRYQPGVKIISVVDNEDAGKASIRRGGYRYLLGVDFDSEQLRACLTRSPSRLPSVGEGSAW